ncbi:MAG TPA: hypothetical protein VFC63_03890 [Blastocatellia bacterium]|nr:hypothetical protein [Blastocatellia bacterium]
MRKASRIHQIMLGLMIGLILLPPPAQAFPVFDIAAYAQRIKSELNRLQEWAVTIKHYQDMFDKAVQQWTTMKGILQTVDDTLAKYKELALIANDLGQIIRGSFMIKREYEALIKYNIKALEQIDQRLKNGIFNPDADLHDFEEYLQFSIGRSSQDAIAVRVQAAKKDAQLAALMDQEAKVRAELATTNDTITKLQASLEAAVSAGGDPKNIAQINEMIATQTKIRLDLEAKDKELQEKITDRLNQYGVRVQDMENFGYQIQSVNQAWASLNKSKDSITDTMDSLILQESH